MCALKLECYPSLEWCGFVNWLGNHIAYSRTELQPLQLGGEGLGRIWLAAQNLCWMPKNANFDLQELLLPHAAELSWRVGLKSHAYVLIQSSTGTSFEQ